MVNLRFHIVSITAVFLSLAIGIVMGSTLLTQPTLDQLDSRQKSLEEKISVRNAQIEQYRRQLEVADGERAAFGDLVVPAVVAGTVSRPALLIATRGVDEGSVAALRTDLTSAGVERQATVWLDSRFDLARPEVVDRAASVLGLPDGATSASDRRTAVLDFLVQSMSPPAADALSAWSTLATAGLVDLDVTAGLSLSASSVGLVLVSGQGAEVPASSVLLPLIGRVAADSSPARAVAAEVMDPLPAAEEALRALDTKISPRGSFVTTVRNDRSLDGRISTVDNLDHPSGRLATVLALGALPGRVGDYGELPEASAPYPPLRT